MSSHLCKFVSPLCYVVFCTPPFCRFRVCYLDFTSSLDSVVFWIIPLPCSFGILLTIYEVQWNNDVNTYVDFFAPTTSCEAPHYSSITQTHINYRIYKPKARLVNWKKKTKSFFIFQNHWLGICYNFFVILTRTRLVLLLPHFVWLNQLKYGIFWEYINNSEYT